MGSAHRCGRADPPSRGSCRRPGTPAPALSSAGRGRARDDRQRSRRPRIPGRNGALGAPAGGASSRRPVTAGWRSHHHPVAAAGRGPGASSRWRDQRQQRIDRDGYPLRCPAPAAGRRYGGRGGSGAGRRRCPRRHAGGCAEGGSPWQSHREHRHVPGFHRAARRRGQCRPRQPIRPSRAGDRRAAERHWSAGPADRRGRHGHGLHGRSRPERFDDRRSGERERARAGRESRHHRHRRWEPLRRRAVGQRSAVLGAHPAGRSPPLARTARCPRHTGPASPVGQRDGSDKAGSRSGRRRDGGHLGLA